MKRVPKNQSISLHFVNEQLTDVNNFDQAFVITDSEIITLPKLLNFSNDLKYTIVTVYWVVLLIGSYFRYIFYKHLYQQYKEKSVKTVDRFILVIALIQHVGIFVGAIEVTLKVLNIEWLRESTLGYGACRFKNYYNRFAIAYACIGSLGLASFRLLCIKNGHFVKDVIGEKVLANTILFFGIGLSVWVNLLPRILEQNWSHLEWEPCFNAPQLHHALELLDDYELSIGGSSSLTDWRNSYSKNFVLYQLVTITELCLYISFFHHMYKHDNCTRLARLLEPAIIRQRNKRNVISFFGQFCSFVMEFIGNVLFIIAIAKSAPKGENVEQDWYMYASLCYPATFAAISFIEVITSSVLRPRILTF